MTWRGCSRWPIAVIGVVGVGLVAAGVVTGAILVAAVGLSVGLLAEAFLRIEVSLDDTHLRTAFGLLRWPVVRIPLAEIERLEYVADLRPARYGGWGYRGSLTLLKRAAVILRRGEGVIFALTGGRRFIVTVDDAESLARAVQDRIAP